MAKTVNYGQVQAEEMLQNGHPPIDRRKFFESYHQGLNARLVGKRGYKDGTPA